MTTHASSRGVGLERAYKHWRERGSQFNLHESKNIEPGVTIAISRERGAGGRAIAQLVADQLGWPVYDQALVDKIAEDSAVRLQLLDKLDEKCPNWLDECLHSFHEERHLSGVGFAMRLQKVLFALYRHGNCVILGRGASQVLPEKRTLRIRLVAPILYRVQRATNHLGISAEAEKQVVQIDRMRVDFVKRYFHKDPTDVHEYDLTMNTARFSENDCKDLILTGLTARQARLPTHNTP
ncbi:cytidylate kinase-like family protein [Bythopirellula polymerisocia]|uniref:Cytidylate kinase n=1 Tax=Bythopirellula polymerisocia TaxID=2528003 RepID=A0A5C6CMJ2_9BACT|nr:cytidylate kinase-like family protein [Bythopirellula polymerisocia]TWU24797.1 cytidylate kinase [Bythopirellula polymerisocia]